MTFKFNALVAAVAALASIGAQASVATSNAASLGNSSVLFVAQDTANSTSIVIDLGVNMADFLTARTSLVSSTGALTGTAASPLAATWSFGSDSRAVNGTAVTGDYAWSAAFADFVTASGGSYTWGVIAADNVTGAITSSNTIFNRGVLATGNPTQVNINNTTGSGPVSTAAANYNNLQLGVTTQGTNATNADGAYVATAGAGYLNSAMKTNFGGQIQFSYMNAIGTTAGLFYVQQASNPVVFQIGTEYGVDTLLSAEAAASFTFDGTTLSYAVAAVPEASSYAMLLAGLAALGFVARRRKQG